VSGAAGRVALLADVHGNVHALRAVLAEVAAEAPDLVLWGGDLTWGTFPGPTLDLALAVPTPARYVRGNAERALLELAGQLEPAADTEPSERDRWMLRHHDAGQIGALATFAPQVAVEVDSLGRVLVCHGSPRSDEELVTEATPDDRMGELLAGVEADLLVTCHTHVQHDRVAHGVRCVNPGSVGLPYEGRPGAYWTLLGADVEPRRTEYDVEAAAAAMRASDDPRATQIAEMLVKPPTRSEAIEHAEARRFSG
jgi:predicted phosphodiesterase